MSITALRVLTAFLNSDKEKRTARQLEAIRLGVATRIVPYFPLIQPQYSLVLLRLFSALLDGSDVAVHKEFVRRMRFIDHAAPRLRMFFASIARILQRAVDYLRLQAKTRSLSSLHVPYAIMRDMNAYSFDIFFFFSCGC